METTRRRRAVYQASAQAVPSPFMTEVAYTVRTASNPAALARAMRQALQDFDPARAPVSIATMDDVIDERIATPRFEMRVLSVFSLLAMLLAAVGIHGVMAYS